jgi:glycosyltransferase involved in cell wall biosynthesis
MKTTLPFLPNSSSPLRIAFVSSCLGDWGGSEELWAGTALHLAKAGHTVKAFKANLDTRHPRLVALRTAGCATTELDPATPLLRRLLNRLLPFRPRPQVIQHILRRHLQTFKPHLVLISQGVNYDGIFLADVCQQLGIPYALLAQKAANSSLPPYAERVRTQHVYLGAQRSYFVSQHNAQLTQLQLGMNLPGAEVIWNPSNIPIQGEMPWPRADGGLRLACVARLFISDKGQDVLLQVLAQRHWRKRAVYLTLYGEGPDKAAITEMVTFLGLQAQVSLAGHALDISEVWRTHHALVLPSRYEGLPLALIEAALAGRPAIASDAGGIAELLQDNETGFLATSNTFTALDEAMERAWNARSSWAQLGTEAARQARATVPADASAELAQKLIHLIHPPQSSKAGGQGFATSAPTYAPTEKKLSLSNGKPAKKAAQRKAHVRLTPAKLLTDE